jgi:hypothetical protein
MQGARGRFSTVRATLRRWEDIALSEEALDRLAARSYPGSMGRTRVEADAVAGAPPFVRTYRVWAQRASRWRVEATEPDRPLLVEVGNTPIWPFDRLFGARSTARPDPLDEPAIALHDAVAWVLDPRMALEELRMRPVGQAEHVGREAVRVAAVNKDKGQTPYLGPGAEDYELLVDAAFGVLLRSAARLHGEEFEVIEVDEISFDEDLDEELFSLSD